VAKYTVTFARTARKELELLPSTVVERIFPKIEALGNEPRPRGVKKLEGEKNMWRIRVGEYRILYTISDKQKNVDISGIKTRGDAYR
jgi:mRNA interferase RelE/StbE